MRIISGKFKGRRLVSFQAGHIRPTTDREKETIFNKLMGEVPEARVLDLYSGTGSLALEALSRGAAKVVCVEKNRKSIQIIRKNLDLVKAHDDVQIIPIDVFRYLKDSHEDTFDLILVDPPFTLSLAHETMEALAKSDVAATEATVVIESGEKERIDDEYGAFKLLDRKEFGDKRVSFFRKES